MTTLQIDDIKAETLISRYGQAVIVEYIKTYNPARLINSNNKNSKLQALKNKKFEKKGKLYEAFSSLNTKLNNTAFKNINIDEAKREYFDKKYDL